MLKFTVLGVAMFPNLRKHSVDIIHIFENAEVKLKVYSAIRKQRDIVEVFFLRGGIGPMGSNAYIESEQVISVHTPETDGLILRLFGCREISENTRI